MPAARREATVRRAVVAAGGLGTRLLPATRAVPKALLPVVDRSLLRYALEELAASGFEEAVVLARPDQGAIAAELELPEPLRRHVRDRGLPPLDDPLPVTRLSATSSERTGLVGQLRELRDAVGDEPFALLLVDELCDPRDPPWPGMAAIFARSGGIVAAARGPAPLPEAWRVPAYRPLPAPDAGPVDEGPAATGVRLVGRYLCAPRTLDLADALAERIGLPLAIDDLLAAASAAGTLFARRYEGRWWDCGSRAGYLSAIRDLVADASGDGSALRAENDPPNPPR